MATELLRFTSRACAPPARTSSTAAPWPSYRDSLRCAAAPRGRKWVQEEVAARAHRAQLGAAAESWEMGNLTLFLGFLVLLRPFTSQKGQHRLGRWLDGPKNSNRSDIIWPINMFTGPERNGRISSGFQNFRTKFKTLAGAYVPLTAAAW